MSLGLNERADQLVDQLVAEADTLRIAVSQANWGGRIIDCGIRAEGGLEAGRRLAEICMAGLGQASFVPANNELCCRTAVSVVTDAPLAACLASQYAGWKVSAGRFFALGSGPMRAAIGKEELFATIGHQERASVAVGILETRQFPPDAACLELATAARVAPERLTLLVAPTASPAGTVQITARSVETALHKLHELRFELSRIVSGLGVAPLPPLADDDLTALGRTNDAILYGSEVTLWVRGDDASLETVGPKIPSSASPDHGRPFAEIFEQYSRDFYQIDPMLFSPAVVTLTNLDSGRTFRFGHTLPHVIQRSFQP